MDVDLRLNRNLPIHVNNTRLLLYNILYKNGMTIYRHTNGPVDFGSKFVSITDCSGYVNALLDQSYRLPTRWSGVMRPYASTYYRLITQQRFFTRINNIFNCQIGDFIVYRIFPGSSKTDNTGHIMMINQLPIEIAPNRYSVNIIDQSSSHGRNDTRFNAKYMTGLGSGYFSLYTDDSGNLIGYSWSAELKSKFINQNDRPLVIGRFNT